MKHSVAFEKLAEDARARIKETTLEEVVSRQERDQIFHLIDVREDHEWQEGHIKGAIHIGRGIIERDIEKEIPDYQAEIVLYCGGGYRSALACDNLQKMGYRNVFSMAGGIRGWRDRHLPEVKP
jgi:rhodanese-related sulfurtransferase